MTVQSIDLSTTATAVVKFNGTDVTKINLNGTEIWTKPAGCVTKTSGSPHVISVATITLPFIPNAAEPSSQASVTYNLGQTFCATNYRVEFPLGDEYATISTLGFAYVKFYRAGQLVRTSPTGDVTASTAVTIGFNITGTIPAGGVDKVVVHFYAGSTGDIYTCDIITRPGTVKLWG